MIVIEGNSELGKNLWHSLKVILTNLYYWEANDFVVNTSSMRAGSLRSTGVQVYYLKMVRPHILIILEMITHEMQ
ncbi:MAG: hypothetical protein IPL55_00210 [Saprospiraceae bacterium]|nr:hypothetical protein [Saprospiraceae bacterium]